MSWDPTRPYNDLPALPPEQRDVETRSVLKAVVESRAALASLNMATELIPNPSVLINTLPLLEAQASSEIENIVTTTDALFKAAQIASGEQDPAVKETLRYRGALRSGYESMQARALTTQTAIDVCSEIKGFQMDVRKLPGTRIVNPTTGEIVYSPPEGSGIISDKLSNWERFIHTEDSLDPIVKMAIAHYQFEAIHPFTDGNGRTGRILNILILQHAKLIRMPVLYLSRYIIAHKNDYYALLNAVTAGDGWEEWTLYMIEAVRQSAVSTTKKILAISELQRDFQANYSTNSLGMRHANFLNVLFSQPYCRIADVMGACQVSRLTASGWLDALAKEDILVKLKVGRERLFLNSEYLTLLGRKEDVDA